MNLELNYKIRRLVIDSEVRNLYPNTKDYHSLFDSLNDNLSILRLKNKKTVKSFRSKYKKYLSTVKWKELREEVFKRDNYKCLLCGASAEHVHHISYGGYVSEGHSYRLECASVCKRCHDRIHFT